MSDALFRDGVPFAALAAWLGDAMQPDPLGLLNARTEPLTRTWDCLHFEPAFAAIHGAVVNAPEHEHAFTTSILAAALQIHLVSTCSARRIGADRWIVEWQCLRHLRELMRRGGE